MSRQLFLVFPPKPLWVKNREGFVLIQSGTVPLTFCPNAYCLFKFDLEKMYNLEASSLRPRDCPGWLSAARGLAKSPEEFYKKLRQREALN